ncbi:MAG: tripartite tricarboxylate transporter TctB family protein [Synergistales bacterium]|nr:tripartite tricarboxylate transporter TctB family protein [Synergistales bacterium]MDY6401495.1 tripartite tricarboxylate transporter TctB family protein [Synergistales bacterium]MDY6404602.1 tripartite tricarboxylate transporter TctB family protein [Synergistales bacterium]MDY6410505.1 tripartite tricarboxylate transporter TctB family protein [Synergistales bacterium]MDY6414690.1 tripartite tricarboxylate transporter TctB family protein [Synergistales bacterium]
MKKTQTKAFTNLICSIILLIFEIWAYTETMDFRVHKRAFVQPATFPQIMICGMAIFTVILFLQSCIKLTRGMKPEDPENEMSASINPFTNRGVAAALFVIILCILYTLLFDKLGYVLVSACVSVIIMWLIGKRDLKVIIPVSILVPLIMWFIFYKLLTVNIPMGVFQPLRDLVDKI